MHAAIKKRGREDVRDSNSRNNNLTMNLTLGLLYRGTKGIFDPKIKVAKVVARIVEEDPTAQLMVDREVLRDVEHIGNKGFSDKMHLRNYTKRGSATVVVEMKMPKTLESLKHDNGGNFVKWLK